MNNIINDMCFALTQLEAEMRAVGWWQQRPPAAEALASTEPFCIDCLTFSEWLQWVYIPKMQAYISQYGKLPPASGLRPIAEEAWKGSPENTERLHRVIMVLDALVQGEGIAIKALLQDKVTH